MGYQLIKYSVNSGDIYVRNDDKILSISYPYYKIDRIELTENQLLNSDNSLHDTFIQSHEDFDSIEDIVDFINHKYIEEVEENPLLSFNKVLLPKSRRQQLVIVEAGGRGFTTRVVVSGKKKKGVMKTHFSNKKRGFTVFTLNDVIDKVVTPDKRKALSNNVATKTNRKKVFASV
jgi:hypothetical protein